MKKSPHRPDPKEYLDNLLINYTKGSYDVDIEEITRLATETDIYADLTPENYRIYFEHLLKGRKNSDHYGELATYLYERGHTDEAIDYLNRGIATLPVEQTFLITYVRDELSIGKCTSAVIYLSPTKFIKQRTVVTSPSSSRARQEPERNS